MRIETKQRSIRLEGFDACVAAMGPTQHGADINVLMVSMTPSQVQPAITVSLLYMNPDQFMSPETLGES